ncbi:MAG: sporulation initiation factor Spo0A C-terminal domain-containing protein [Bacillota bacterium]|nr:sporulation initiation factor Spo0A C-terminal domain-containing protein [Bacillota bacterium]
MTKNILDHQKHIIAQTLCRLGITANYAGFQYTIDAVTIAAEDIGKLQLVTKQIYPDIAAKYNTSPDQVRRNIDKACGLAWERNPKQLSELAMYELKKKPGTSEFLAIVTVWLFY